jgi:integrase
MSWTMMDVIAWAEANGESRDAVYELRKIPARLGLTDDDLGLIPADIAYFEAEVAPSGYAAVTRSADVETAKARGNARARALLRRFHAAQSPGEVRPDHVRTAWDALIEVLAEHEGFPDRGALLTQGASRSLYILRARARVTPNTLDNAEIARLNADLPAEKRKTLRKAVKRLNMLRGLHNALPGLADMLPREVLAAPAPTDRAPRMAWDDLPAALRADAERVIARALETPADQAAAARARIAAGEDRASVLVEFETARTRRLGNRRAAVAGYRGAVAWVWKSAAAHGLPTTDVATLLKSDTVERAIDDHVMRASTSRSLKRAETTQTIANRLTVLTTLARHGLRDTILVEDLDLLARDRRSVVQRARDVAMNEERRVFLAMVARTPQVAVALVNAPRRIAEAAEKRLTAAEAAKKPQAILSALRLYASAVLWALQMSRPVRSGNLIKARVTAAGGALNRLAWIKDGQHAELTFARGEVKNDREVVVSIAGDDARILWRWHRELRPRYLALRGIAHSDYLIPGAAKPRLLKDGVDLPAGTVSPSTLDEIWDAGAEIIGVAMTPHMARHAVATLILARRPGDYAFVAAVLADTEDTVRRHYGHEEGKHAAAAARKALLKAHPDLFKQLRRAA